MAPRRTARVEPADASSVEIREERTMDLERLAGISCALRVDRVLDVVESREGAAHVRLEERVLTAPWTKDYDAIPGNHPTDWPRQFDLSNWGLLSARIGERWIGGAVLAWKTAGVDRLEGRDDRVVLWDIRIESASRRRGVGDRLFAAAVRWAEARGCRELDVETQNVNVPACRFYARQGCTLRAVDREAYPDLPGEVQLTWSRACGTLR